jgi:hypothetical protein
LNPNRWQYYTRSRLGGYQRRSHERRQDNRSDIVRGGQSDTVAAPELSDDGIHVKMYDGAM